MMRVALTETERIRPQVMQVRVRLSRDGDPVALLPGVEVHARHEAVDGGHAERPGCAAHRL